jgi:CRISPR system Cascade subunit CasD
MQSWGSSSRFGRRDTEREPTKSGFVGMLAAAAGIDRDDWSGLEPLTRLRMGVRHDRAGILRREYQTAGCAASDTIIKADGTPSSDGIVSHRDYLADAVFLAAVAGEDEGLLERLHDSLRNPVWPLFLGRKSYVPSEPPWLPGGLVRLTLRDALASWPWLSHPRRDESAPDQLLLSIESDQGSGSHIMDQPIAAFSVRRFSARCVTSEWIPFPKEVSDVPS